VSTPDGYRDVRIVTASGVRTVRFRKQPDGSERFAGEIFDKAPGYLAPHQVSILPDGRYLCDVGAEMPDLYAASAGAAGSQDMLPPPMGGETPHSLPDIGGPGKP